MVCYPHQQMHCSFVGVDEKLYKMAGTYIKVMIFVTEEQNPTRYHLLLYYALVTCFGHHYVHHQELTTIVLVTT